MLSTGAFNPSNVQPIRITELTLHLEEVEAENVTLKETKTLAEENITMLEDHASAREDILAQMQRKIDSQVRSTGVGV